MNKEEIEKFATRITKVNQRTILTLLDNELIVGYFEGNFNRELTNQNLWNFVLIPNDDSKNSIQINGDSILKIEIIDVY
jgi:hypothetical protein